MNVIEMAREAGFKDPTPADGYMGTAYDRRDGTDSGGSLERFAALVRAAALEEAALKCEQYAKHKLEEEMPIAYVYGARECAAAIRQLKEAK